MFSMERKIKVVLVGKLISIFEGKAWDFELHVHEFYLSNFHKELFTPTFEGCSRHLKM